MDFAFVPLREDSDQIYLDTPLRRRISNQAVAVRRLIEDDAVNLARLWKPVIELGQEALFAAAMEAGEAEMGPAWQMGAMALTAAGQLGKELAPVGQETGEVKVILDHWRTLGDKVEGLRERMIGKEPSERELIHLIFNMVEQAEMAGWGATPAELARIGGMGMFVAGYLGLKLGRPDAGVALAALAAMDELELLNLEAGEAAVAQLRQRGLDIGLGAAMPFLIEDSPETL